MKTASYGFANKKNGLFWENRPALFYLRNQSYFLGPNIYPSLPYFFS
jgi:hypothetical protein